MAKKSSGTFFSGHGVVITVIVVVYTFLLRNKVMTSEAVESNEQNACL